MDRVGLRKHRGVVTLEAGNEVRHIDPHEVGVSDSIFCGLKVPGAAFEQALDGLASAEAELEVAGGGLNQALHPATLGRVARAEPPQIFPGLMGFPPIGVVVEVASVEVVVAGVPMFGRLVFGFCRCVAGWVVAVPLRTCGVGVVAGEEAVGGKWAIGMAGRGDGEDGVVGLGVGAHGVRFSVGGWGLAMMIRTRYRGILIDALGWVWTFENAGAGMAGECRIDGTTYVNGR